MEDIHNPETPENEENIQKPRPAWQVWAARAALVLFIGLVIMQYIAIARGGS